MIESSTNSSLTEWSPPESPFPIRYPLPLFREIDFFVVDGFRRIPYGGLEVGALLYGKGEPSGVTVLAFRPIECQHSMGPSFALSARDLDQLAKQITAPFTTADDEKLEVVGWLISNCRSDLALTDQEVQIYDEYFPGPRQITLLAKPEKMKPTRYGFLARQTRGRLAGRRCEHAFVLPLSSKGEVTAVVDVPEARLPHPVQPPAPIPPPPPSAPVTPLSILTPPAPPVAIPEAAIERAEPAAETVTRVASEPPLLPFPVPPLDAVPMGESAEDELPAVASDLRPIYPIAPEVRIQPSEPIPPGERLIVEAPQPPENTPAPQPHRRSLTDVRLTDRSELTAGREDVTLLRREDRVAPIEPVVPPIQPPPAPPQPVTVASPVPTPTQAEPIPAWAAKRIHRTPDMLLPADDPEAGEEKGRSGRPPKLEFLLAFLFAAAILFVGVWTYLRLSAAPIPMNAEVHTAEVVVTWPPEFTANAGQSSVITWTNGKPVEQQLLLGEQTEGKVTIQTSAPDVVVQLRVPNWYRERTGQVRVLRVSPPPAPPTSPQKPTKRFAPLPKNPYGPPPLVGRPVNLLPKDPAH